MNGEHLDRADVISPTSDQSRCCRGRSHRHWLIRGLGVGGTKAAAPPPSAMATPVREQASNEILETTKGLEITQQQAVDQLQIVQDQLAAQQLETKKLSAQIAALTDKVDALQGSVANISAPSPASAAPSTKSRH
jgi:uncharacterized coiled-coil protein SlyX